MKYSSFFKRKMIRINKAIYLIVMLGYSSWSFSVTRDGYFPESNIKTEWFFGEYLATGGNNMVGTPDNVFYYFTLTVRSFNSFTLSYIKSKSDLSGSEVPLDGQVILTGTCKMAAQFGSVGYWDCNINENAKATIGFYTDKNYFDNGITMNFSGLVDHEGFSLENIENNQLHFYKYKN